MYAKNQTFSSYFEDNAGDTGTLAFPEYDWKIHPDGTKVCGVIYWVNLASFDSAYYAPYATPGAGTGPDGFYPDVTSWYLLNDEIMGIYAQIGQVGGSPINGIQPYVSAPGLIESKINITLTGPNPEDYTLSLDTSVLRDPNTQAYCVLLAGYAWHDIVPDSAKPDASAKRGDLCVLDVECYGRRSDGAVATLLSLKNLTSGKEIRTFGIEDQGTQLSLDDPRFFNSAATIVAYDMPTLSFAIQHKHTITDFPVGGGEKHATHFGIGIYTLAKFRETMYPSSIDPAAKAAIDSRIAQDGRALASAYTGGISLMPINDFTTWGDADMDALRRNYASNPTQQLTYSPPINSLVNPNISFDGLKFYDDVTPNPPPSTGAYNWFYFCLPQGGMPAFPLFDITVAYPGWYQYTGEITRRIMISPYTTFFAHPNGSWAFFDQQFIYNRAGAGTLITGGGDFQCLVPLDVSNFEHCIFDKIAVGGKVGRSTSSAKLAYSDMRATFGADTAADQVDNAVVYQLLTINWQGYSARMDDHAYYTGTKIRSGGLTAPNYEYYSDGNLQCASLGAYWKSPDGTQYVIPQVLAQPVTFSSCVMISA